MDPNGINYQVSLMTQRTHCSDLLHLSFKMQYTNIRNGALQKGVLNMTNFHFQELKIFSKTVYSVTMLHETRSWIQAVQCIGVTTHVAYINSVMGRSLAYKRAQ